MAEKAESRAWIAVGIAVIGMFLVGFFAGSVSAAMETRAGIQSLSESIVLAVAISSGTAFAMLTFAVYGIVELCLLWRRVRIRRMNGEVEEHLINIKKVS